MANAETQTWLKLIAQDDRERTELAAYIDAVREQPEGDKLLGYIAGLAAGDGRLAMIGRLARVGILSLERERGERGDFPP